MPTRDQLSAAFAALADPTRRDILARLRDGPLSVGELAKAYPISRPAVSQHLAVLEHAGLVARGRRAQWNDCSIAPDGLDDAAAWIERQRAHWTERFDRLDTLIAEHHTENSTPPERNTPMTDATQGFTIERTFAAPPEEIWRAWTDPDLAAQWWHPRGMTTPRDSVAIDARVGGTYAYTMVSDETGEQFPTGGVYREVVPYERLAFTWGEPDGDPDTTPLITVTLAPDGDGTRMTFALRGIDGAPGDNNVYDGWQEAFDILADTLGRSRAG